METIVLKIYDLIIKINFYPFESKFLRNKLKEEIKKIYKGFLTKNGKKADFTINFKEKKTLEFAYKRDAQNKEKIFINLSERNDQHSIVIYYDASISNFQFFLKGILSELLSVNKGFTLHSSGINFRERAALFLGKPGSGKSTAMTLLSEKYPAIADDSLVIKKSGKGYYVHETPFIETNSWIEKENKSFPVAGLFFLKKAQDFKVVKISDKSYILNRMIKQIWTEQKYLKQQMKFILEFIEKTNFYFLFFAKDKEKLINLFKKI